MLADILRSARQERHLTQAQVAALIGCTTGYVAHLESGRALPSDAKLIRLAEILRLDKRTLILHRQKEKASGDVRAYYENAESMENLLREGVELTEEQMAYAIKIIRAIERNQRVRDAIDLLIENIP